MKIQNALAGFTLTALLSVGTAWGADPRLMNLVMPNAASLAGANVTNAQNTPFGQYVLSQMTGTMDTDLQSLATATGFDPRRDVTEVLAAAPAVTLGKTGGAGLLLALGNFNVSQISSAITTKEKGVTVATYGGATLITVGAKESYSIAFLGSNIAALGDTASVKAAVDRSAGVNSIDPALLSQAHALSTTQDAWAVTTNPVSTLLAGLDGSAAGTTGTPAAGAATSPFSQVAGMFSSIQSSSGGVKFGSTVLMTGQAITNDPAKAKSLADIVTALVSIVAMSGAQQTPAGAKTGDTAAFMQLLQGLKVTADGATINLALSIPEAQLEGILKEIKSAQPVVKKASGELKPRHTAASAAIASN